MMNTLKRLNSDQLMPIAMAISVGLHLVFIMAMFAQPDSKQQSSLGNGQVILLEHIVDQPTKITDHTANTIAASESAERLPDAKPNGKKIDTESSSAINSIKVTSPHAKNQTAQTTSNKGVAIDQSGTDATPQQQYRQLVTQHLLKKIKSAGSYGKATVNLNILKMGIATHVTIELLDGPKSYQGWLKSQVLNANPFPVIPSGLNLPSIKLAIQVSHQIDE
jgi:hypothetical protein